MNEQLLRENLGMFYRCANEISIVAAALDDFEFKKLAAKLDKVADNLVCVADSIRIKAFPTEMFEDELVPDEE